MLICSCNFYPFVDESLFVEREYHEIYGDPIYDVYVYETMLMLLTAFSKKILLGIWIVQTLCKIELLKILDINRSVQNDVSENFLQNQHRAKFVQIYVIMVPRRRMKI